MQSIFKYQGIQVLLLIALYLSIAQFLPLAIHQGLYTISLFIKDLLMWMLPLTVGFFIAHAVGSFKKQAPLFIISLILFETFSNFASVWYAYLGGHLAVDHLPPLKIATSNFDFTALWRLPIFRPAWWSADKGAFLGLVLGSISALTNQPALREFIEQGKEKAQWILSKLFSRVIPLFVLGFVARMYQMHLFQDVVVPYSTLLMWLLVLLAIYIIALFILGSNWTLSDISRSIKNLLPAGGLAFTSGCSISTMPWTIEGASKNLKDPSFAKAVIPATTNIQQIGDCITNTFLCFLLYRHFFGSPPDFATWALFSAVFVIARFATAAVIGGAIFIMLPIYESYLSFNAEMIAIILAFNVILDPIVTSCNVIANGALCRIYEKFWNYLKGKLPVEKIPGSLKEK
ncbi:MAG: cation:dicarboxylase symporter family transporter [Rhabdochlamydiaceae bacterium]|nr:cation:dicarboxylase symporter family transporter [Rhabdochlamydiaceae bacterium]